MHTKSKSLLKLSCMCWHLQFRFLTYKFKRRINQFQKYGMKKGDEDRNGCKKNQQQKMPFNIINRHNFQMQ